MKKLLIFLFCVLLVVGSCGCNFAKKDTQKITVVTTIFPLYDFARAIGGDNIDVKMLIKPGSEVHNYDPLPSDMMAVYDSDLFLYIGGESDKWVDALIGDSKVNSLELIDCVAESHTHIHPHHNHADEHIWTSPDNAILMLQAICESLVKLDPENENIYRKNCDAYIQKISSASAEISATLSQHKNPFILVADRFPFAYFTEKFGIKHEAAFDGCAVSTDISMKTMMRLTKTIEEKGVKAVFCTELSSRNIAKALQEELGVEIIELHSAHNVSAADFKNGITYVDIMQKNKMALERGICS